MTGFLDMGGYGLFVWPAYALVFAILFGVGLASWRRERQKARLLAEFERRRHGKGER
ncbi:MAG: heme exporter protein CcmD [Alphaproteobacteria bacterium]|nr:MAG: heme exporter protein CcmD [Alphaproteobacteria bacterium]